MTSSRTCALPRAPLAALLGAAALAACQTPQPQSARPAVILDEPEPEKPWRALISPADGARLDGVQAAWTEALAAARAARFARSVRNEGKLLDPATALPRPAPAPGSYRCRVIRIAAPARRQRVFAASGPFFCYVGADGALLSMTRQTGPDRPGGYLYDDTATRQIFVGASARAREQVPPAYGEKPDRDVVGIMERVDDFRYRFVIPRPRGAILEVYELVPSPG